MHEGNTDNYCHSEKEWAMGAERRDGRMVWGDNHEAEKHQFNSVHDGEC